MSFYTRNQCIAVRVLIAIESLHQKGLTTKPPFDLNPAIYDIETTVKPTKEDVASCIRYLGGLSEDQVDGVVTLVMLELASQNEVDHEWNVDNYPERD